MGSCIEGSAISRIAYILCDNHWIYYFQDAKTSAASDLLQPQLNLGLILPHSIYNEREYNKAVAQTLTEIQKTKKVSFKFLQKFEFGQQQVHRIMMKVIPSPTG